MHHRGQGIDLNRKCRHQAEPMPRGLWPVVAVAGQQIMGSMQLKHQLTVREFAAWLLVLGSVLTIMALQYWMTHDSEEVASSKSGDNLQFDLLSRYAVGVNHLFGRVSGQQALRGIEDYALNPVDRLRLVMLTGEIFGGQVALNHLDHVEFSDAQWSRDAVTLRTIYGQSKAPTTAAIELLIADNQWFGQLAASFGKPTTDPMRQAVLAKATRTLVVVLVLVPVVTILGISGIVLLILAIVFWATGKLRPAYRPSRDRATGIFLESFGIFLIAMLALSALNLVIYRWFDLDLSLLVLLSMPLSLLWPRWRGLNWSTIGQAWGWTRGCGFWREIAAGLVGYVAGLPLILLGVLGTVLLGLLLPGDGAHPVVEDLSTNSWKLLGLYLLAVGWAPLFEELIFRGAFYHHMRCRSGFGHSALVVGVIFAAIHPQGLIGIPVLTAIAVVIAAIREWRGSIIGCIAAHAVNNLWAITLLLLLFR